MPLDFTAEDLLNYLPGPDGGHSDDIKSYVSGNDYGNIQLLLAFAPKVGGTFLRTVFQHLANANNVHARLSRGTFASSNQIRDIYFPVVARQHLATFPGYDMALHVMHLHLIANQPNRRLIELFDIQTLVMKRNLLDALTSFYDDREQDSVYPAQDPITNLGNVYQNMDPDSKRMALITFTLPWYLQHFIMWREYTDYCRNEGLQEPFWLSFNELKDDATQLILKATQALNFRMKPSESQIEQALKKSLGQDHGSIRLNKGVNGRGLEFFNKEERDQIDRIIDVAGRDIIEAEGLLGYP